MEERDRIGRLLNIIVGASVAFLPAVGLRLFDDNRLPDSVIIITLLLSALIIINEWRWLSATLGDVTKGISAFSMLTVIYVLGLVGIPLSLVAVEKVDDTFLYFAIILVGLSIVDIANSAIAMIDTTGKTLNSYWATIIIDFVLVFLYGGFIFLVALADRPYVVQVLILSALYASCLAKSAK